MQRRSSRAAVPAPGGTPKADHKNSGLSADLPDLAREDQRRTESISPTPTVGTAPRPSPAPEALDRSAPQPRLRRPMNSFLLFSNEHRPKLAAANPDLTNAAVSVLLGERWKSLPAAERTVYVESARKIKDDFKAEHPEYRYARSTRNKGKKRKLEERGMTPPLSLQALALAGASLACQSPLADAAPKGFFTHANAMAPRRPDGAPASSAEPLRPSLSRGSTGSTGSPAPSYSMLDQLCHVADGVQRA